MLCSRVMFSCVVFSCVVWRGDMCGWLCWISSREPDAGNNKPADDDNEWLLANRAGVRKAIFCNAGFVQGQSMVSYVHSGVKLTSSMAISPERISLELYCFKAT